MLDDIWLDCIFYNHTVSDGPHRRDRNTQIGPLYIFSHEGKKVK